MNKPCGRYEQYLNIPPADLQKGPRGGIMILIAAGQTDTAARER